MYRRIANLDVVELRRRYAAGAPLEALAAAYGVSRRTVSRRLREAGWALRPRGAARLSKDPGAERLRELHVEQGLPAAEVARRLGMSRKTASRWLRRAGIARDRAAARGRQREPG